MNRVAKGVAAAAAALTITACQPAGVSGVIGSGERFSGVAVGFITQTGVIRLTGDAGTTCSGTFQYTSRTSGNGQLSCSDGRTANFDFISKGFSGTGTGVTNTGQPVNFGFGLTSGGTPPQPGRAPQPVE